MFYLFIVFSHLQGQKLMRCNIQRHLSLETFEYILIQSVWQSILLFLKNFYVIDIMYERINEQRGLARHATWCIILQNLNLLFLLPCSRVCGWNIGVRYKTPIFPSCQLSFGEIEVFLIVDCGTL